MSINSHPLQPTCMKSITRSALPGEKLSRLTRMTLLIGICGLLGLFAGCKAHKNTGNVTGPTPKQEKPLEETNEKGPSQELMQQFDSIARESDDLNLVNKRIEKVLTLFASQDASVLIIIHRQDDTVDYDRPSTIRNYLEYLKDQKKSPNAVESVEYDDNGKIIQLTLIKK